MSILKALSFIAIIIVVLAVIEARRHHGSSRGRLNHNAVLAPAPFKFKVCDGAKGSIINALSITPSPIILGKNLTVAASVTSNRLINSLERRSAARLLDHFVDSRDDSKASFWSMGGHSLSIGVDGLGSCTIQTNLCDDLAKQKDQICPVLQPLGLPCQCPFQAGTYNTPSSGISVATQNPGISWLTNGNFYVKVVLQGATEYACTEAYFSLGSSDFQKSIEN